MHTEQSTQQLALCCCSLWQHSFPLLDGVHRCWVGQQTSSLRAHQRETVIRDCLCLILSFTLLPLKGLGQFLRSSMAGYPHMGLVFIWVHSFIKQYSLCLLAKLHKNTYFLTKDTDSAEFVVGICKDKMQHHTKYTTSFAWSEKKWSKHCFSGYILSKSQHWAFKHIWSRLLLCCFYWQCGI